MSDHVISDFCKHLVLMIQEPSPTKEDNPDHLNVFWLKFNNMYSLMGGKSKEEWSTNLVETKKSFIKVDIHFFMSIIQMVDEIWKWPLIISFNIEICRRHLENIPIDATDITPKWEIFLKTFLFLANLLFKLNTICHIPLTSTVQLCLKQIKNSASFFVTAIEKNSTVIKKYASQCLMSCLDQLQREIITKNEISCNEFIDLMDSAINHLDNLVEDDSPRILSDNMSNLKELVDELLCHAMTTAHVTTNKHSKKEILSKAQVILREMESLKDALTEQEKATINLAAQSLCNALCSLERLVNSAVLKLVLHVGIFGDTPVKNLINMCQPHLDDSIVNRKAGDLDELIICFDTYLDRIMQIGSFAISCSSSVKKAVEIKSCLASFESMEAELVPCVTAMYLNPIENNKRDLRLLVNYWLEESKKFCNVLDTIIDPAAYTEVVKSFLLETIKELETSNYHASRDSLKHMVKAVRTLNGVVKVSIQLETYGNNSDFEAKFNQVLEAVVKCENLYSNIEEKKIDAIKRKKYVTKYTKNLLDSVDSLLSYQTSKIIESQLSNDTSIAAPSNYYKLCVSDFESPENTYHLAHHIAEGERLAKKAVLYNTPKRTPRIISKTPMPKSVVKEVCASTIAKNRHRFSTKRKHTKKEEMSDMELTMLLEDIKGTDGTFSADDTLLPYKDFQGRNLLDLFTDWTDLMETSHKSLSCTNTDQTNLTPDSNHIDTLERMCDLHAVQEKIENLRS